MLQTVFQFNRLQIYGNYLEKFKTTKVALLHSQSQVEVAKNETTLQSSSFLKNLLK